MKKLTLILILAFIPAFALFATDTPTETPVDTATETPTPSPTETPDYTATETPTETPTVTETSTITMTPTITPTFTASPTPQAHVYSYPNPVNTSIMGIAYPIPDGKTAVKAHIVIRTLTGEIAADITDTTPNGYTTFPTEKFARGSYFYTAVITFSDGTSEKYNRRKFAVVK